MTDAAVRRPPILTGACLYLGALAAIMSIRAVTLVSSWNSENRAADFGGSLDALRDAGLSASGAETFYKTLVTVVAVLAACAVVFAIYTSRGDRVSRAGLTATIGIVGVLTFVGALGGTVLFAMVGALAVVFTIRLWTGEIRTYFRTLAGHEPPPKKTRPADPFAATAPHHPSETAEVAQPNAPQAPAPTYAPPPPGYPPQGYPPPGYHQQPVRPGREPLPRSVSIAVWTTFIGSVVAAVFSALMLLAILVAGFDYDAAVEQGGFGADMIGSKDDFELALRFITVLSSIAIVLGIAGLIVSIRVLVTRRSGGVALFVLAVVTIVVSGLGVPLGLPWTAAAIVAAVQLRRPEARAWFVRT